MYFFSLYYNYAFNKFRVLCHNLGTYSTAVYSLMEKKGLLIVERVTELEESASTSLPLIRPLSDFIIPGIDGTSTPPLPIRPNTPIIFLPEDTKIDPPEAETKYGDITPSTTPEIPATFHTPPYPIAMPTSPANSLYISAESTPSVPELDDIETMGRETRARADAVADKRVGQARHVRTKPALTVAIAPVTGTL